LKKRIIVAIWSMTFVLALALCSSGPSASAATVTPKLTNTVAFKHVCASSTPGHASCLALERLINGSPSTINPEAHTPGESEPYDPAGLHSAYFLATNSSASNKTVAVVDAYNDPNAASDLAAYRAQWGLPACTLASQCFKIIGQTGSTTSLPANAQPGGWDLEESLDIDMVSAICENCHILLVEANSNSDADLGTAENVAFSRGSSVVAISNSYGQPEFSGESSDCNAYYQHNYKAITASSGDDGLGVSYPAVCSEVVGVGGTTLNSDGSETAWNTSSTEGAGGGCSAYIAKPSWENASVTKCTNKAVADVSAVADPNTGVWVYDSYANASNPWVVLGGTSESSPIIASVFALAGNTAANQDNAAVIWSNYSPDSCLFEVNHTRYTFQTGLGTPDGRPCF
jgi:subtilase family serine protease